MNAMGKKMMQNKHLILQTLYSEQYGRGDVVKYTFYNCFETMVPVILKSFRLAISSHSQSRFFFVSFIMLVHKYCYV